MAPEPYPSLEDCRRLIDQACHAAASRERERAARIVEDRIGKPPRVIMQTPAFMLRVFKSGMEIRDRELREIAAEIRRGNG